MSGAFEAGESFTISALAGMFSTSHMPVREAIRRLVAENGLRISSTGTAVVPDLDLEELRNIRDARLILEPATAEIAFKSLGKAEIARLKELVVEHKRTGENNEVVAMLALNRNFHFLIYEASGNPVLVSQIENLWLRSSPYVRFLSDKMGELLRSDYREKFSGHHDEMISALDAGDVKRFRDAMCKDVAATYDLMVGFLKSKGN